jgi:alpha-L-fucosidase
MKVHSKGLRMQLRILKVKKGKVKGKVLMVLGMIKNSHMQIKEPVLFIIKILILAFQNKPKSKAMRRYIKPLVVITMFLIVSCTQEVKPPAPVYPVPSEQQFAWHQMELTAFIHFTTNTFTDKEWGFGDESPDVFNPTDFDADQWVTVLKETGFTGLILTAKHHDGFCLWPTAYTEHSVKNSRWRNGQGDVVGEVADACRKHGMKFGAYLSPWDRNRADYGDPSYIDYYRNQLKELVEDYGPLFEIWFDGANGGDGYYGGANETRRIDNRTYYDWPTTWQMIREWEPNAILFSDAGPDIRWCGNERGFVGETNWNTINPDTLYPGKHGIEKLLNTGAEDGTHWIPAEVDVSIRPGWFYHAHEDSLVKSPETLFDIYLTSVGRGSNLLLNIPPDRTGQLHPIDVQNLRDWKNLIDQVFKNNLAPKAKVSASSTRGSGRSEKFIAAHLIDGDPETYWATDDDTIESNVELTWEHPKTIQYVVLQEYIPLGQRIRAFSIKALVDGNWTTLAEATTIGYKRIVIVPVVETTQLRINFHDSKACPVIAGIEVY